MKKNIKFIPWWARIIAKIILSRLPGSYKFWQKIGFFRHGSMDDYKYAYRVFNEHIVKMDGYPLTGKVVLEIGPGDGISTAIIAASHNASSFLVDAGDFVSDDVTKYLKLCQFLYSQGLTPPTITKDDTVSSILRKCDSSYHTKGVDSFSDIDSCSVDYIFSQAVLEHVHLSDFTKTVNESYRVLKNHGKSSHQVDLRDHLGGGLNNLRFRSEVWESNFFMSSGFYTNRIQFKEMESIFVTTGFLCKVPAIDMWAALPLKRNMMSSQFRKLSDSDLRVRVFDIVALKRYKER